MYQKVTINTIYNDGIVKQNHPIRFNFGCGGNIIPGYVNVDYEQELRSGDSPGVDIQNSLFNFVMPEKSVEMIRVDHLFEHFDRPTSFALLAVWNYWLKPGGELSMIVPDFEETAYEILDRDNSYEDRLKHIRHLTGSHKAFWAFHRDLWTKERLAQTIQDYGYRIQQIEKITSQGYNPNFHSIQIVAQKKDHLTPSIAMDKIKVSFEEMRVSPDEDQTKLIKKSVLIYHSFFEDQE